MLERIIETAKEQLHEIEHLKVIGSVAYTVYWLFKVAQCIYSQTRRLAKIHSLKKIKGQNDIDGSKNSN
jgi:hypothetical protein